MPFCLTTPPTLTLRGVFAFHHKWSPFIIGVCTPSIRCLCNSSLSILVCIGKVFACCLHQEHKRLPIVQLFTQSLLWASSGNSSSPCTCCLITVPPTSSPSQSSCAFAQFMFSRFLPIPCLYLTAAHPVTTPVQVKIGCQSLSPSCISLSLSGSSSIFPLRNHNHRI